MNKIKTSKISKYVLSLIALATLSCSSLSFGMDIFQAIEKKDIKRVEEILKDKNFNINKAHNNGWTPLHWACYRNNQEIVELLLAKGADANKADNDGWTPFHVACVNNNQEIVKLLLAHGADVNKADNTGNTPLYLACSFYNQDIVKSLLAHGADVNIADKLFGITPLYIACSNNNQDIVKLLLANGADANKADNKGWTPLHWVCRENYQEIAKLLLANGADVDQRSLDEAADKPEILKLLKFVQSYDAEENKIKFIFSELNDENYNLLVKRALAKSLNEIQKDETKLKSIESTVFGKLYDKFKNYEKFVDAFDIRRQDNIYEFIRLAAKNNHIYLEKGFIEKNLVALKSKATLEKRKFTDATIQFADNNMEDESEIIEDSFSPTKFNFIKKEFEKRKRKRDEENSSKRRKLDPSNNN